MMVTSTSRLTTACQGVPDCAFESPHAGNHLADVPTPAGTYCAPLRCYCGACPPVVEDVVELSVEELRERARVEAARWRAREAARAAARAAARGAA